MRPGRDRGLKSLGNPSSICIIKGHESTMKPSRLAIFFLLICGAGLMPGLSGCGSGNPNEREYSEHAPPGLPSENPNESVAQRKARTRTASKQELKAEARNKAAEAKAAKKADGAASH